MTGDEWQNDPGALNYSDEDRQLAGRMVSEHYDLLVTIARAKRRRAGFGATMSTSDILHESYLKLDGSPGWRSSEHFIRAATLAMRHVIVDHARRKLSQKRGGGAVHLEIDEAEGLLPEFGETPEEIVAIAELLKKLEATNPRWMRIVDARYFSGMTEAETADALGLSDRTVRRDWQEVRSWIAEQMGIEQG